MAITSPVIRIISLLLVLAGVTVTGYWALYSAFAVHDDTGYVLAILKQLSKGMLPYQEVFSQYGPVYHQSWLAILNLAGSTPSHDSLAMGTLVMWVGAAAAGGILVWRTTRCYWTSLIGIVAAFLGMQSLGVEYGHPLSLCSVILAAYAAIIPSPSSRHQTTLRYALAGLLLAAISLIKINLGAFTFLATVLAWLPNHRLLLNWALSGLLASILVVALIGKNLVVPGYAAAGLVVVLSTALIRSAQGVSIKPPKLSHLIAYLSGGAVAAAAILLITRAQGVTWPVLWDSLITRPLGFGEVHSMPPSVSAKSAVVLAVVWGMALGIRLYLSRDKVNARVVGWLTVLLAALSALALTQSYPAVFKLLLLLPVMALLVTYLLSRQVTPSSAFLLLLGASLAIWQWLAIYPISGSQAATSRFFTIVTLISGIRLALAGQILHVGSSLSLPRSLKQALAVCVVAAFGFLAMRTAMEYRTRFLTGIPLELPGSTRVRLPLHEASMYRCLAANLHYGKGPLLSLPGLYSLHAWSQREYPGGWNAPANFGLLNASEFQAMLDACKSNQPFDAVVRPAGIQVFSIAHNKLLPLAQQLVQENAQKWLSIRGHEIWLSPTIAAQSLPLSSLWKFPTSSEVWQFTLPERVLNQAHTIRVSTDQTSSEVYSWSAHAQPAETELLPSDWKLVQIVSGELAQLLTHQSDLGASVVLSIEASDGRLLHMAPMVHYSPSNETAP